MRTAFIEELCTLAEADERVWLLCGDLGYSVLERFSERFPDRFVNVGVAEQNMMGIAAGIASCGNVPFVYSIANFPIMRCLEQIRNDVCYHNLPVKIVAVGGGMAYAQLGYTHHGVEDLAVMRVMPNMTVVAPGDPTETRGAVRALVQLGGPGYLRLGKAGEPNVHEGQPDFIVGQAIWLRRGNNGTIISTGGTLEMAIEASKELDRNGYSFGVLSMHTLSPLDEAALTEAAATGNIVTVEEHGPGGLAAAMAEFIASAPPVRFTAVHLSRGAETHAYGQAEMRERGGVSLRAIVDSVLLG